MHAVGTFSAPVCIGTRWRKGHSCENMISHEAGLGQTYTTKI